jgi:hypothetical protein
MTRAWPVLITSLLALLSPAAVNNAAAWRDCTSEQYACAGRCATMVFPHANPGSVERAVQGGCVDSCRNARWSCDRDQSEAKKTIDNYMNDFRRRNTVN